MNYSGMQVSEGLGVTRVSHCRRSGRAVLALGTKYGIDRVELVALDRISALQVAATLEFLRNNLPATP